MLGAGRMGHGIAYAAASHGADVILYDPDPSAIAALPARFAQLGALLGSSSPTIATTTDLAAAVDVALVIEAAPEVLDLKREIFARLNHLAPADTILASNTSAIPISAIASAVTNKARVVGTHFWNPPHLIPLVEVVQMAPENEPSARSVMARLAALNWTPVHIRRDIAGFVGNRMQHALKREAIALVANGVCDAETVDTVVKLGFGARLGVIGPLEQSDMVGLELTRDIHNVLIQDLDRSADTQPYLLDLIARGETGMAAGKGFRTWTPEAAQVVRDRLDYFLSTEAAARRQSSNR